MCVWSSTARPALLKKFNIIEKKSYSLRMRYFKSQKERKKEGHKGEAVTP